MRSLLRWRYARDGAEGGACMRSPLRWRYGRDGAEGGGSRGLELVLELLRPHQARIAPAERHQLVVAPALRDPPVLEHEDLVGVAHRADPVRDDDRGAAAGLLAQRAQDALLGVRVDA